MRLVRVMIIFITDTKQVRTISNTFIPLQSGSVFYKRAKLTGAQYKHRYVFKCWMVIIVIFTLDDHVTLLIIFCLYSKEVFFTKCCNSCRKLVPAVQIEAE